jgi:hypothetical protein
VKEPNSFGDPEFLKDPEFINEQLSAADTGQQRSKSQARSDGTELVDALAAQREESHLNQELEQARLATGATGAAIALVRGEEIICLATAGSLAPSLGVCVDPHNGLSGSCIETRRLQQCVDTQTDPRVDPEACRHLGVRSIVVLPLMDGDELFGIVEVLSSRANAFGQHDLDTLQALTGRIVESRRQNWEATATVQRKAAESFLQKLEEVVPQDKNHSSESDSRVTRREHTASRNDIWTPILGTLVIGAAVLLGTLMGWRFGWEKATLGLRASSARYRANAPSRNRRTDHTVFPSEGLQPSSAWTEECGQSAAAGPPTQPPSGGLTVCEGGRVIFRLPPPTPSPSRGLQTSKRSPGLEAGPTRR